MSELSFFKSHRVQLLLSTFFVLTGSILISIYGNQHCFLWINQHLTPSIGQAGRIFSALGEWYSMGLLILISLWMPFRKTMMLAFIWFSGACYSWLFKLWLLKGLARPLEHFQKSGITINLVEGVDVHHFNSFPSGHTLTAFSAAFAVVCLFPLSARWIQILVFLFALCCGISRIVLVQHWPLDVAGGAVLGILASFSGQKLASWLPQYPLMNRPIWSKSKV
jgi:membrane-associated phospholipid phosphatase